MIIIKSRAPVALIGGHYIYHCEETVLKPITPPTGTKNAEEARQMAAFQGVDLSKNFYFRCALFEVVSTLQAPS
jgi:phosphatidylinositol 3,5-bisphosphate 5-phosphatase